MRYAHQLLSGKLDGLNDKLDCLDDKLDNLKLERIAAFPLLFANARAERTDDGETLDPAVGVKLVDGQFKRWRDELFPDGQWPAASRDDVAYCVVGHSSPAHFKGFVDTDRLNREAANCRGQNAARALAASLKEKNVNHAVATCRWRDYKMMSRPEVASGEHLSDEDKWLFNRSAFVYPISLNGNEHHLVGQHCTKSVAKRMCARDGSDPECVECLQCSVEDIQCSRGRT